MSKIWALIKHHYAEGWLLFGLTWLPVFAWFTPTALPAMLFIWGVPFMVFFGRIRAFWPAATATAVILIMAFLRSDFVAFLVQGHSFGEAFATKYWFAPIFVWFVAWAVICGFDALKPEQAPRVVTWFGWLMVGLAVVQLIESLSGMSLRIALNNAFYAGARPEMLIVGMANCNCFLTLLFWPLAFHFVDRRQYAVVGVLALAVVAGAVVSDTNAHLLATAAGTAVFFAVRHWPAGLRRLPPWRVMAVASSIVVVIFPVLVYAVMATGLAGYLKAEVLPSWAARIDIWSFTVNRGLEKPWFGWGYEASRIWDPIIPNHPHNMSLQAWVELGVPGLLVLGALWFVVFWLSGPAEALTPSRIEGLTEIGMGPAPNAADTPVFQRAMPYILALGTAYYVINTISYGLWRSWYYCLGAVVVGVTILVLKSADTRIKLRTQL